MTGALIVYQFPLALLNAIFIFPILHFTTFIGSGFKQLIKSLIMLIVIVTGTNLFLFGSLNTSVGENWIDIVLYYMN